MSSFKFLCTYLRLYMPLLAISLRSTSGQADFTNDLIRRVVVSSGAVTTLAGGPTSGGTDGTGTAATFFYPGGACMDAAGTVALVVRAEAGGGRARSTPGSLQLARLIYSSHISPRPSHAVSELRRTRATTKCVALPS